MESTRWSIRKATTQDVEALVDFNCGIARETEDKELDRELVTRGVSRGMEQGDEVGYYVAYVDDALIGGLMLTREWSDWRDGWLAWVQSVYVVEEYRGKGVFRSLMEYVAEAQRKLPDVVGIRLYVENENQRAQAVYLKTGFVDPHYKVMEMIF